MKLIQDKDIKDYTTEEIDQYLNHPKLVELFQKSWKQKIDLNNVSKATNRGDLGTSFYESDLFALLTQDSKIEVIWSTRSRDNKIFHDTHNSRLTNILESEDNLLGNTKSEKKPFGRINILQNPTNVEHMIKLEKILKDLVWKKKVEYFKKQLASLFNLKCK
jgi:hypothetical protein